MAIQIKVQIEVEIHFSYKIHADCQTVGHAPGIQRTPWKRWLKSCGLSFDSVVDSAYTLCLVCYKEGWKMFRACYCSPSPPIHWRFKFYVTLICLGFRWRISIFSMDFLRGNTFRLKTRCEFYVWALCCGFREFQYLARPSKTSPESGIKG